MTRPSGSPRDWIARRRLHGQLLRGRGAAVPGDVARRLTAMQSQERGYARWSVAQRTAGSPGAAAVDAAYDEGRLLRTHVLRPTWHYVAPADLRWLMRLSGPRVNAGNARRYTELGLDGSSLARSDEVIAEAVSGGPRTRPELAVILEAHGIPADGQRMPYMLMHAELQMVICSGPMQGKQHTYAPFDQRVPGRPGPDGGRPDGGRPDGGSPDGGGPDGGGPDGDEALAELAWRYFSTRGPATVTDFSWWSGLKAADARRGVQIAQPRLTARDVDGVTYWFHDRGAPPPSQRIDLVQCYDELIISYSQSRDILQTDSVSFPVPRHIDGFWHVMLLDGRLLGHWRARTDRDGLRIETRTGRPLEGGEHDALADAIDGYRSFANRT